MPWGDDVRQLHVGRRGETKSAVLLSSFMRMPLSSEPQSIRTRSEESEEGGVPPNAKVDASSKFSSGPRR